MTTANAAVHPEAQDSLRALALGDGFGDRWFHHRGEAGLAMIRHRTIPADLPWHWTDDTALALALLRTLTVRGEVDQRELAAEFAETYHADAYRKYGKGMHELLPKLLEDPDGWPAYTRTLFGGEGSLGNGAAMRVAPLGAWFHTDPERAAWQAGRSAEVTHAHPEGVAGAVAVAVAAALAAASRAGPLPTRRRSWRRWPRDAGGHGARRAARGPGRAGLDAGRSGLGHPGQRLADARLGYGAVGGVVGGAPPGQSGRRVWTTAEGFGDVDTTCAITGGSWAPAPGSARCPGRGWRSARSCQGGSRPSEPREPPEPR